MTLEQEQIAFYRKVLQKFADAEFTDGPKKGQAPDSTWFQLEALKALNKYPEPLVNRCKDTLLAMTPEEVARMDRMNYLNGHY